ncbi:PAS domain S-box protein [Jiangella ureilytica]|uniref:protein-glutamate O-methyltransferase n=1 Tax=Jiangella ureilytica TaxID=2530374 RepID=A0A4R4RLL4_9ACTN|nr:CheR family methyltransferase [Jiangella ureilytica]TDC50286.1 PAS domain S-box protein [Jiangella ureilytica]
MPAETDPAFEALLGFLRDERGFDFTGYKRASLMRRVRRRMESVGIDDYEEYHDHLTVHPEEFTALFNTILINVTSFFRDADAWDHLRERVLPDLLARRDEQPLRAWSAGCASGEEAYTLAMVFAEVLGVEAFRERVKIYATDVDEEALSVARAAAYSERDVQNVPEKLRQRYFEQHGQRYLFRKELRRSVIFGRNDLVQDAPISHVDVLVCRNALMYFTADAQAGMLQRMHFALRPDGVLFLGKAEMLLSHADLFRAVDLRQRFFRKTITENPDRRFVAAAAHPRARNGESAQLGALRDAGFMSSAAAQLVLDPEGRLAMANNRAGNLFGLTSRDAGRPIQDLEISYRPIELRSHLDEAASRQRHVWVRDITWHRPGGDALFMELQVVPLHDESGTAIGTTVIFHDVTHHRQLQDELSASTRRLETAYEELQSTNEELETTNEELQSTVEELETTNEELQSTNEELETMNEELQSMNDELRVTNDALREQQDQVTRLNFFMTSVLSSIDNGVVVVDGALTVLAWNSKAADLWGVRTDEAVGVPLFALDIGLPLEQLVPMLKRQLVNDGDHETITIDAVNRRGRPVAVHVTATPMRLEPDDTPGAILVMDVIEPPGGQPPAESDSPLVDGFGNS